MCQPGWDRASKLVMQVTRLVRVTRRLVAAIIQLAGDGVSDVRQLLFLFCEILRSSCCPVLVKPLGCFSHGLPELWKRSCQR